MEKNKVLS